MYARGAPQAAGVLRAARSSFAGPGDPMPEIIPGSRGARALSRPHEMALQMKSSMLPARVAAGRRMAAPRLAPSSLVALPKVVLSAPVQQPASAVAARRVQRANSVVVRAAKVSVGDLKKRDLDGKRVLVRAGEHLEFARHKEQIPRAAIGHHHQESMITISAMLLLLLLLLCRPERAARQAGQHHGRHAHPRCHPHAQVPAGQRRQGPAHLAPGELHGRVGRGSELRG